ncbi:immunoglobulin lambda-like polypeptide 1, partial [Salvelinus namaycush]|uniref:immunoglobulin lambda-like polypeptide 1 n=1 Tax=Salvelinus namaycush TaxID=8040 RepID=UPI00190054AA
FGPGTKLIVTDGDLATPAVTLFPPSTEDLKSSRATLVCLTSNLSQKSKGLADVRWMSNSESVTEDVSTSPAEQQPDKTFKISSYLTIQTAEWDKGVVVVSLLSLN